MRVSIFTSPTISVVVDRPYLIETDFFGTMHEMEQSRYALNTVDFTTLGIGATYNDVNLLIRQLKKPGSVRWTKPVTASYNELLKFIGGMVESNGTFFDAARDGHLELLQWIVRSTSPVIWSASQVGIIIKNATTNGHLEILKWVSDTEAAGNNRNPSSWGAQTINYAIRSGNLEVVKWLLENKCLYDQNIINIAALRGHLHILKWMYKSKYDIPLIGWTMVCAAKGGHLNILKWLRVNGCPWDIRSKQYAAESDHGEVVAWLHYNQW